MPPIPITVPVLRVPLVLSLVLSEFLLGEGVPPVQGQGTGAPQSRFGECGCPQSRSVWGEGVSSNSVWVWGVEYTPQPRSGGGVGVPQSEKWGYASSGTGGYPLSRSPTGQATPRTVHLVQVTKKDVLLLF